MELNLFTKLYALLRFEGKVKNQVDFANQLSNDDLSIGRSYISLLLAGAKPVTDEIAERVNKLYPDELKVAAEKLRRNESVYPDSTDTKKPEHIAPAENLKDDLIDALKQAASAEKDAKLAEREAKEAYRRIADMAGEFVTKERFAIAELRTQVLRAWTVETLAIKTKTPEKALETELNTRIEDAVLAYMQGTSRVADTVSS